jgi:NDP-sugar pyrophosphorylase family protein
VDPEFPRFWNYVDPNGISSRVDLTAIFNPEAVGRLTIADTQGDILAAGSAKRLGARTEEASKGAIDMVGVPLSSFTIGKAALDGVPKFLVAALGYWNRSSLHDIYLDGSGLRRLWSTPPVVVDYQSRESPFGSADCVRRNLEELGGDKATFILQLDNVFGELDFNDILAESTRKAAFMTLTVTTVDDPTMYGTVKLDRDGRVTGMCEKSVLTLTEEDAGRLNPNDAVGETIKLTEGISRQLGLAPESVDYPHIMGPEDARKIDYRKLVGRKVSLSRTQLQHLGYTQQNCGLYYLAPGARVVLNSQECMDMFNREGSDIGGNLIGWLVKQRFPVYGYDLNAHSKGSVEKWGKVMWRDAGVPRELLETMWDIVEGKVAYYQIPGRVEGRDVYIMPGTTDVSGKAREEIIRQISAGEVKVDTSKGRVVIGEDVEISPGTTIEGPTYVGRQAKVGVRHPKIRNSITITASSIEPYSRVGVVDETRIPPRGTLGNHVAVKRSIVGEHTTVVGGENDRHVTRITDLESAPGAGYQPTLIGSDCRISAGCVLEGVEISPHHTIETTHMMGAKVTSYRSPWLQPTNKAQEDLRRKVEYAFPDPSAIHIERIKSYQHHARDFALLLDEQMMLFSLGRAEMEARRAASIRQDKLLAENERHRREMERLFQTVHSIEREKPGLDLNEVTFARAHMRNLGLSGSLDLGDADTVKSVQYFSAASKLLERGERKSSEALVNRAQERGERSSDQAAKNLARRLAPRIRREIEISTKIKGIERTAVAPGDQETARQLKGSLGEVTRMMVASLKEGLITSDRITDFNQQLSKERKRLSR